MSFPELDALFESNKQWAAAVRDKEPEFFPTQAKGQAPEILWIGCADSRVPESVIMERKPGEVFVHRNIANQFQPNDDSANSLLDYAVMTVGIKHVIVTGHSGCGGCIAAYGSPPPSATTSPTSPLTRFLDPVVHLRHSLADGAGVDDLIRENVKLSVKNLANSSIMQKAWRKAQRGEMKAVYIHGWHYDLASGHLHDLGITAGPESLKSNGTQNNGA